MNGIRSRFEKFSKNNVLLSILMVVLGLVLFIWPGKTLELVARLLGIALLVGAAITAYVWYRDRRQGSVDYASLAISVLCLVVGLVVLIAPKGVVSLLPKLIGIGVLINGVLNLAQALDMRSQSAANWSSSLVLAVLTIVAGLFLIIFSFGAMKAAVMVIGGVSIYNGLSNLFIESRYRKMGR